jgi:hypothetical protein
MKAPAGSGAHAVNSRVCAAQRIGRGGAALLSRGAVAVAAHDDALYFCAVPLCPFAFRGDPIAVGSTEAQHCDSFRG